MFLFSCEENINLFVISTKYCKQFFNVDWINDVLYNSFVALIIAAVIGFNYGRNIVRCRVYLAVVNIIKSSIVIVVKSSNILLRCGGSTWIGYSNIHNFIKLLNIYKRMWSFREKLNTISYLQLGMYLNLF